MLRAPAAGPSVVAATPSAAKGSTVPPSVPGGQPKPESDAASGAVPAGEQTATALQPATRTGASGRRAAKAGLVLALLAGPVAATQVAAAVTASPSDQARYAITSAAVYVAGAVVAIGGLAIAWRSGRRPPVIADASVLLPEPPPGVTPALATALLEAHAGAETGATALAALASAGLAAFRDEPPAAGSAEADAVLRARAQPPKYRPAYPAAGNSLCVALLAPDASVLESSRLLGPGEAAVLDTLRAEAAPGSRGYGDAGVFWRRAGRPLGAAALAAGWFADDPFAAYDAWRGLGWRLVALAVLGAVVPLLGGPALLQLGLQPGETVDSVTVGGGNAAVVAALAGAALVAAAGVGLIRLARRLPALSPDGVSLAEQLLAYRNSLERELRGRPEPLGTAAGEHRLLPWTGLASERQVWAIALGLEPEARRTVVRAAFVTVTDEPVQTTG